MIHSPGWVLMVLSFLIVIGPLVFVHELGHYLVARWCGVKADAFSIGFGREIFGWTDKRGTRWKVGWLPLGGYVKFAGDMSPASAPSHEWLSLPAEERNKTFQAKHLWQRFLIVAAGPITNFLAAILLFMAIFAIVGYPTAPAQVTSIEKGSAAEKAGLQVGDRILRIGGKDIDDFTELAEFVRMRPGAKTAIEVRRGDDRLGLPVTLKSTQIVDRFKNRETIGQLGIKSADITIQRLSAAELPGKALRQTRDTLEMILLGMKQLIVGERSVKELGGPLKMAQVSGQQASLGWLPLFWLMAVISINLGFINLLPVPMLDGGHLLFYIIEGVRRKPLRPETQEWAFKAGLAALLTLMIFVTLNDLASFGLWQRVGGLIG